jgi:hypothetical protein
MAKSLPVGDCFYVTLVTPAYIMSYVTVQGW